MEENVEAGAAETVKRWARKHGLLVRYLSLNYGSSSFTAWCRFFTDPTPGHIKVSFDKSSGKWTANGEEA